MQRQYDVIVADPPWNDPGCERFWPQTAAASYPRMTKAALQALPVSTLGNDTSLLLMWTIASRLDEAIELIACWGYRFVTVLFVWVKTNAAGDALVYNKPNAYYPRKCCEYVLLGRRGAAPLSQCPLGDVIMAPRRDHSRKPDEFFTNVEAWLGGTFPARIELFSREIRPGWDAVGNELHMFTAASLEEE